MGAEAFPADKAAAKMAAHDDEEAALKVVPATVRPALGALGATERAKVPTLSACPES